MGAVDEVDGGTTGPSSRLWVVRLDPGQTRPALLRQESRIVGVMESLRSAKVVFAENEREAARAYSCSVWDLRVGMVLLVSPLGEPSARFQREYEDKSACRNPVTIERPILRAGASVA